MEAQGLLKKSLYSVTESLPAAMWLKGPVIHLIDQFIQASSLRDTEAQVVI